jgi:murein DD-endopeptidase MepM/ murein hydrolase activator NlpD
MRRLPLAVILLMMLVTPLRAEQGSGAVFQGVQGQALFIPLADASEPARLAMAGRFRSSLFCTGSGCYALIAVGMDSKPRRYSDRITFCEPDGSLAAVDIDFDVAPGKFQQESFSLPEAFLTFSEPVLKRVRQEQTLLRNALNQRGQRLILGEPFMTPVRGSVTAPFGGRRVVNGKPPRRHYGVDLRCASGDPVRASQDGTVMLTGNYYLNGRVVIINHGDALSSSYNHLSAVRVATGQSVRRGDVIGLCGATGRVNGPHLHFGISIGATPVNPLAFIATTVAPPSLPEEAEEPAALPSR